MHLALRYMPYAKNPQRISDITHVATRTAIKSSRAVCGIPWYVVRQPFIASWYIAAATNLLSLPQHSLLPTLSSRFSDPPLASLRCNRFSLPARCALSPVNKASGPRTCSRCCSSGFAFCRHESCCVQRSSSHPVYISPPRRPHQYRKWDKAQWHRYHGWCLPHLATS